MSTKYGPIIEPELMCNLHVIRLLATSDATRSLFAMLIELRCASMAGLADGFIPADLLRHSTKHHEPDSGLTELVRLGLASEVDGGWQLDWSGQVSADVIEQKHKSGKDWDAHRRGNHTNCADHPTYRHDKGVLEKWQKDHVRTDSVRALTVRLPRGNSTQLNSTQPNGVKGLVGGESKKSVPTKKGSARGAPLFPPARKKAAPTSKPPSAGGPKKPPATKVQPAVRRSTPKPEPTPKVVLPEYQRFLKAGDRNPVQVTMTGGTLHIHADTTDLMNWGKDTIVPNRRKEAIAIITEVEKRLRELFYDRTAGTSLPESSRAELEWMVGVPEEYRAGIVELAVEARKHVLLERDWSPSDD